MKVKSLNFIVKDFITVQVIVKMTQCINCLYDIKFLGNVKYTVCIKHTEVNSTTTILNISDFYACKDVILQRVKGSQVKVS